MDDNNPEKLYYSISEVSAMLNVNASHIRFWEKEFEILKPKKNTKGNRQFTKADIENLKLIYYLTKEKGYTLNGANEHLKTKRKSTEKNMKILESLRKVRQFLVELKQDID
ncbi:MAG: MerR family transcriptional regulator [Bacteroidetes bacterium]|nr:MerR family transcriptional regulator [Bacteroidota bacterium]